ncbi:MAG: AroM family protein [Blautia sp.]|nr:AroM family protein [Blautia sp.]MDY4000882.1 AroM family protein [Blautia sp.]
MKIGAVTIGQAPRVDVTADILRIFDDSLELVQAGGLDGLTREEIAEFAPGKDDYVLVSRLQDGSSVTFAERYILPRLQDAITKMEEEGCSLIMMFCTGSFPETLSTKKIPMIYPCELLNRLVPLMTKKSSIICMTPSPLQTEQCENKWRNYVKEVKAIAASPYGEWEALEQAAEEVKNMDADLIVLDCIGYTQKMKEMFAEKTGKKVVLPRTLLARVVSELTDI